ncbi:MAG: thioredoxin [Pirellulales bacterium]
MCNEMSQPYCYRFLLLLFIPLVFGCESPAARPALAEKKSKHIVVVSDANFQEVVLKSEKPVMVDFWASWCPPCELISPTINEIADQYAGRAVVAKLDVDASPRTVQAYGVRSIPAVLVFKDAEVVSQVVGVVGKSELTDRLDSALQP